MQLVAIVIGSLTSSVFAALFAWAVSSRAKLTVAKAKIEAELEATIRGLETSRENNIRMGKTVARQQKELRLLEEDLAELATPDAIRARLRRVLSPPEDSDGGLPSEAVGTAATPDRDDG